VTLEQRLLEVRAAVARWRVVAACALGAGGALLALALTAWVVGDRRWLTLPPLLPFVGWGVAALAAGGAAVWLGRRLRDARDAAHVAAIVEREQQLRRGMVVGALELSRAPEAAGALGAAAAQRVAAALPTARPLAPAWVAQARGGAWRAAGVLGLGLGALAFTRATAGDGWRAALHPLAAARGTLLPALEIVAPPLVVRGAAAPLGVRADGRRSVHLRWRATGGTWQDTLLVVADGRAALVLPRVEADLRLVATDGRTTTDTARVGVVERPYLGDLVLRADYPAYLGRPAETLAPGEGLVVPRGTVLRVTAQASVPLARVALASGADTARLALSDDGGRVDGAFTAARSGRWTWRVEARVAGPPPDLPPDLRLEVLPDSAPSIEVLNPGRDTTVALGARLPITITARDDHGLGELRLVSWRRPLAGGESPAAVERLVVEPGVAWSGTLFLDAAARGLEPGDAVRLLFEAVDASPWRQVARSRELLVRVPALDEQRALARAFADTTAAGAQRLASAQRALEQRTGEEARAAQAKARDGEAMTYEDAAKAKRVADEQRRMAERARQMADQAAGLERQLRQAGGLDSALSQRLREVQALMREAMTPALMERLRQLEESAAKLDGQQTAQGLERLQQDQRQLREQLERAANIMQRAALEGAMQTLKDEAAELAARQQALADSLGRAQQRPGESGPRDAAERLAERTERFARDAAGLEERLRRAKAQAGADGAAQAEARAAEASQRMQQAGEQAGQRPGEASKAAQAAADAMRQAAEALQQGRQEQVQQWKKEIAEELDRTSQELAQMSQRQQQLAQQAQQGGEGAETLGEQSALQQGMEQASRRMSAQGRSTSLISQRAQRAMADAQQAVREATRRAADRNATAQQRAEAMREASAAMDRASASVAQDRDRVNRSESASGFSEMLEELQRAAQQQQAASSQAQQLLQLPPEQRAQLEGALRALARQQREVARTLDEAGTDDPTGRADQMADEARALAERLERGGLDPAILARQQQLFRRLLDAGRALEQEERDPSGRREARAGRGEADAAGRQGTVRGAEVLAPSAEALRALPPEARRLAGEYFRRLNAPPKPR
jgi:hypothetical protein